MRITLCERLMWRTMHGIILRFVRETCPGVDHGLFKARFRARWRQMCAEVDDIGPMRRNPLRISLAGGIVWLAAYDACDGAMDEAAFSRMIRRTLRAPLIQLAFRAKRPFHPKAQRRRSAMAEASNAVSDSPFNWKTEYAPGRDAAEYFCTYRRCGLCALGEKYGHAALIAPMCQLDTLTVEMMGGVLHRTQTLATGGSCCDFHVVKRGSRWEKEAAGRA